MSETQTANKEKTPRNYGPATPPKVKVSEVLQMLENGKDRKAIAAHYGLNANQTKDLFQHPKLKGKKTLKDYSSAYVLEDDTDDSVPVYVAPVKKEKGEGEGQEGKATAKAETPSDNGKAESQASNDGTGAPLKAVAAEAKGAWD